MGIWSPYPVPGHHLGIEIRMRSTSFTPGDDVLMQANSDNLALIAAINGHGEWYELLRFVDNPLILEIKPTRLPDESNDE